MHKRFTILVLFLLIAIGWLYRYPLLFKFQYARLKGLACQEGKADFINDSCLNKIWVHRVDSRQRFDVLANKFAGYETDIVWDSWKRHFLVYHPPLEVKPIKLDKFLTGINTERSMFWFDTRETPAADTANILKELNRLDSTHHIKMNAIIELYDTTMANYLADHDYWVALNIDPQWIKKFTQEEWLRLKESMSPKISFISQEDTHVPFMEKQFPGKDIITWSIAFKNYYNRKHLKELVRDQRVKVVLVNVKSKYYQ